MVNNADGTGYRVACVFANATLTSVYRPWAVLYWFKPLAGDGPEVWRALRSRNDRRPLATRWHPSNSFELR